MTQWEVYGMLARLLMAPDGNPPDYTVFVLADAMKEEAMLAGATAWLEFAVGDSEMISHLYML